tara:strand:- start:177 stop:1055 length:879 start_codon:yes stop_codon:yes gene_type:complete
MTTTLDISIEDEALLYNQSASDYHAAPGASASRLNHLARSPAHLRHAIDNPTTPTRAMIVGSATHSAILEPHLFDDEWACLPDGDGRSKEVRQARAELAESFSDDRILKPAEHAMVVGMRDSVLSHETCASLLENCQTEVSAFWHNPEFDVPCKSRIDALPDTNSQFGRAIVDIKTTQDASDRAFSRNLYERGYFRQAAHYLNGVNYLEGYEDGEPNRQERNRFIFICVERSAPYCVAVYELDAEALSVGRTHLRHLLAKWKHCFFYNHWPAYVDGNLSTQIHKIGLPSWAE